MSNGSDSGFFTGLIIGAAIGLAFGFLYAPQEGQETRRQVKEKIADIRETASRGALKVRENIESKLKREDQ